VTATNSDGSVSSVQFGVSFTDVAPSVAANSPAVGAAENATAHNSGTFSDYDDAVTITVDHGAVTQNNLTGIWSWSGAGDEDHPYTVTVTATNADGTVSTAQFGVTFTDVAPVVSADLPAVNAPENLAAH